MQIEHANKKFIVTYIEKEEKQVLRFSDSAMDVASSLHAELPPSHQTGRVRTTEQLSVISDLSSRFAGEKVTINRTEQSNSITSDSSQAKIAKEQITTFLNTIAGNEEFHSVNFPKILQELTVQAEDELEVDLNY